MKRFFLTILAFFLFFVPQTFATDGSWVVDDFSSKIVIEETGVVQVTETLAVDFRSTSKHGIYRDIPYAYQKENGMYYTEIVIKGVYQDNVPAKYSVSKNDANIRIKIGDADKTISGVHTYVIDYTAKGVLQGFSTYDEFYWNVTGNGWDVFIKNVSAQVILPKDGVIQFACYQGASGSKTACASSKIDEKTTSFGSSNWLSANEGMTIAVGFAKGMVPLLVVERPKTFLEKFLSFPSLMTVLAIIISIFLGSFYVWFTKGRDFWHNASFGNDTGKTGVLKPIGAVQTTVVEFTPPETLRPAEMGVLVDEKADTLDVVATIIDLTSRGYMTITEIPKKWIFGSMDYELIRTKKAETGLLDYETYLLSSIFSAGDTKKISSMKNTFYTKLAKVKEMMYEEMVQKGYFSENPEKTRNIYTGIGIGLLIAGVSGTFVAVGNDMVFWADIAVGIAVGSIFLIIFSRFMGRRSAKGSEAYRRIKGYQLFISTAEKYRQRFFEKKSLFTEVLPYAIVFGLTGKFAQAMKDIGLQDATLHGYYGVTPFNTRTFGESVNTFSSSFSSVAASAPSSSGSGGGGSSGGGFGGGGGGSW